jgi:D-arabinan exo alpha-(1,3)/(1,5)-arabinofuranosidase (non-reducing end)
MVGISNPNNILKSNWYLMRTIKLCLFLGMVTLLTQTGCAQNTLTYIDLIDRLSDMEYLATLPQPGEECRQWSSYDRASQYSEKTGTYVNWDANSDGFNGKGWIRKENGKLVLAEIDGPGCIWRIWSATPQKGHVRIYLDGQPEPVVDLPFVDYFNGTVKPFNRPALVNLLASGKNNYTPIPFQKSCKIVADKDYGEFHHFTYTLFPKGTKVPTFSMNLTAAEEKALDEANELLSNCGPQLAKSYPEQKTETFYFNLSPGQKETLEIPGQRAITSVVVNPQLPEDVEQQRKILREIAIRAYWDNEQAPSVWCPLGDFFGTGPGANMYNSLPMGMTKQGFYSNWYMPFENHAKLEVVNEGQQFQTFSATISHSPHSMPAGSYGKFHAKWHRDAFLPTEPERWIDWTMLKTTGRGRFCGVQLEIWNPKGGWWGEGDEKFFVDGEKFPSTYGTGSEDYFGYAWSDPALFENCYHNQTISEDNKGHISVNRWHIVDNVPFQTSFEGTIEKYYDNKRPTQYACVAYWYQAGGKDLYTPVPVSDRVDYYSQLSYPMDIDGMYVLEKPTGMIEEQHMGSFTADKWQGDRQLWWTGELGAQLKIGLDIKKQGTYKLATRLTKAADYGIVQFYLDGNKVLEPMDMYHPDGVIATKKIKLGKFKLDKGQHVLTVEVVGTNPKAIKRYMVGIDYVELKKNGFLRRTIDKFKQDSHSDQKQNCQTDRQADKKKLPIVCNKRFSSVTENLPIIPKGVSSRAISWENRNGLPGQGGMAAGKLGVGRKGAPCMGKVKNGETATLMDVEGCGVIRHIWITLPGRDPIEYRNLILRMYWDNSETPSVEVPIGDFFGVSHGKAVHLDSALISNINGKGFNSWFAMPFRKHARITIQNDMPDGRDLSLIFFQIDYEMHESLPENVGLFHAQFRRQNPTTKKQDFILLDNIEGPGYFVGCVIGIRTLGEHWWGEGEIKFYIDEDTDFPTICGTGTEDYFGDAWGMDLYQTPYLGCTVLEQLPENAKGLELISMYRFHVLDPINFRKNLKATVQQIGWFPDGLGERIDDWCSVAYWYQATPVKQMPTLPNKAERTAGILTDEDMNKDGKGQWGS